MSTEPTPLEQRAIATGVFELVDLQTSHGDFVASVVIPVFRPPADALIWGNRFFVLHSSGEPKTYAEGMCWTVLPLDPNDVRLK